MTNGNIEGKRANILIVEDERIVAEDIRRSVINIGYSVSGVVSSGEEALVLIEKELPDLVLMDIVLKGKMNGIKVTDAIRSRFDIPVIYLTAYADPSTLQKAKVTEPFGYILKPFEDREVESAVEMALYKHGLDRRLRESEERYRTLFEDSRDAIYMSTAEGRFVLVNDSTLRLFGYSRDEFADVIMVDLFVDANDYKQLMMEMEAQGSIRDMEVKLKHKNGEVLECLITASLRKGEDGSILGYHGIIHDVTARKRAEDDKMKIQAQLIQAQKMEAVGVLAGGIAHDFNNLLTIIQGNCELGILNIDGENPVINELQAIQSAAVRASDLTGQLLLFSRKQPMKFIMTDINKTIEDLLKMLHRLIGEDVSICTDLEEELPMIRADRGTMEQVVMNLAINARDAMPGGGTLTIRTEKCDLDEADTKQIFEVAAGQFIRLSVSDTGSGMDERTLSRIFEPFFSTKAAGRGTGLGLSVVYGIIEQHDGWVKVESTPGAGTRFDVYLPARESTPEEIEEGNKEIDALKGKGEGILIVEDEEGVRHLSRGILKSNGYRVFEAEDAAEAGKMFKKHRDQIQAVLCDVVLPDQTGIEVVEELSTDYDIGIVLTSGYIGWKSQWPVIQEKGYVFLQKPYTMHDLLQAMKSVLKGGKA